LTDRYGRSFSPESLRGRATLVNVIHTSCPEVCAALTDKFISIARKLGPDLGTSVSLLSVSNDPEHDRPEKLQALAESRGAAFEGWTFATGSVGNVEAVLRPLGIGLERGPDGEATHVTRVFLVGPDGCVMKEYDGMSMSTTAVASELMQTSVARR
jgi:protein SCO1/2